MPSKPIAKETPPDLPPEKAYAVLNAQLEKLQQLRGRSYQEAEPEEDEWQQLTEKLVIRSFGSGSPNHKHFHHAIFAGEHYLRIGHEPDHAQNQRNFEARQRAFEAALRSGLAELELDLPDVGIKGVYQAGEEYEYYRDVTACLKLASGEIFIIDPYLSTEVFDVYASAIPRSVRFRLLSNNVPSDVLALAQKYASGGNFEFRQSSAIHDGLLFADERVWLTGQSLKDAARKKPTYIVEFHDASAQRQIYKAIWDSAVKLL